MTVIACDGRQIAADSLMCYHAERAVRRARKLIKKNGHIFAVAGTGIEEDLSDWFLNGARPHNAPQLGQNADWQLLVIKPDGKMLYFTSAVPYAQPAEAPFTMGCGADYAMGAMKAGASAFRAVQIACDLNVYCGGEIVVFDMPHAQQEAAE